MNHPKGSEQPGMMYSQSSGALLARLRPQNDNLVNAMNGSASATALNTMKPRAMNTISSAPALHATESAHAKVARLKSEAGTVGLNKTIGTSASALQLSTNPEIKAQVLRSSSPDGRVHQEDIHDTAHLNTFDSTNTARRIKPVLEGTINVAKNSFIASLNLSQQQLHDLYKVPHTFFYLNQKLDASSVYNLELVPLDKVDKNSYFTLSKEGITQFRNKASSFTGLVQWEREFRLYHKIREINFFLVYKSWKVSRRDIIGRMEISRSVYLFC